MAMHGGFGEMPLVDPWEKIAQRYSSIFLQFGGINVYTSLCTHHKLRGKCFWFQFCFRGRQSIDDALLSRISNCFGRHLAEREDLHWPRRQTVGFRIANVHPQR